MSCYCLIPICFMFFVLCYVLSVLCFFSCFVFCSLFCVFCVSVPFRVLFLPMSTVVHFTYICVPVYRPLPPAGYRTAINKYRIISYHIWNKHVSMVYSVANILWLKYMAHIMLLSMFNVLQDYFPQRERVRVSACVRATPSTAYFCSSLMSCFQGMLPTYFLNISEIVPPFIY
jgi:hypothetical protein